MSDTLAEFVADDLGDPWAVLGDGNQRTVDPLTGAAVEPETLRCCFAPLPNSTGGITKNGCPNSTKGAPPSMHKACPDPLNCSLPDPETGKYGSQCVPWDEATWPSKLRPVAKLIRQNSPSGVPGTNFMGGIHPRLKRPVGRRLAYAAAAQLRQQELGEDENGDASAMAGATTGPTISGCAHSAGTDMVTVKFNASLLGGEGLLLRPFDANETGGWLGEIDPRTHKTIQGGHGGTTQDSSGMMVCTIDPDPESPMAGQCNASTCLCQSWNYAKHNATQGTADTTGLYAFWYCEVGPGWKPPPEAIEAERQARIAEPSLGFVPPSAPCVDQWKPAPLKPMVDASGSASTTTAVVDFSRTEMVGRTPLAIRLGWPLGIGSHGSPSDTCCPTAALHARPGNGACLPGNCPLYSGASELPANPFFAVVLDGKCRCPSPQTCDE